MPGAGAAVGDDRACGRPAGDGLGCSTRHRATWPSGRGEHEKGTQHLQLGTTRTESRCCLLERVPGLRIKEGGERHRAALSQKPE